MINVQVSDIDKESAKRSIFPGFRPALEVLYRNNNVNEQYRALAMSRILGLFLYDLMILSDYSVAKDDFWIYVVGRFFVFTPIYAFLIYGISRKNAYYEIFVVLAPFMMAASISILMIQSHGAYRSSYLFGNLLIMISGSVISRARVRYSIPILFAQYIMYQTVVMTSDIVAPESLVIASMFGILSLLVGSIASYTLEHIGRNAFLLSIRVRLLNEELKAMTLTDPLTRLGNRRSYEEATSQFWAMPSDHPAVASFILIDIDKFKSFNDNYGHSAGDLCLSTVARCVASVIRKEQDIAVRFGGEEFLVFLPGLDFTEARQCAEQIRLAILAAAIPHVVVAPDAVVSASLGVATASTSDCTPADLVIRADMALYAAKHAGRNRIWPPLVSVPPAPDAEVSTTTSNCVQAA